MSGSLLTLFDGLFGASFRGIDFHIPNTREEVGRRVAAFWFPGRDDKAHQDLGAYEGPISVTGLIIGDDYVARARALRSAFLVRGPGTLVHPWLGEIEVVLAQPATITFSDTEVRVARFEATFERAGDPEPGLFDTLQRMLDRVQQLRAEVRGMVARVLAPVRQTVALIAAVQGFAAGAASTWRGLIGAGRGLSGLGNALDAGYRGLTDFGTLAVDTAYGGAASDRLDAIPVAIGAAGAPPLPPAIGPAAGAAIPYAIIDPDKAAGLLLDAGDALAASAAAVPALSLGAALQARSEAVAVAATIEHASREDAIAWRDRLDTALAASARDAAILARSDPIGGQAVWSAVSALRNAVLADYNDRIGRLPAVRVLLPRAGVVSAWAIALDLVGDDPAAIAPMMEDLVRRNGIRSPATVPADLALEYLA